MALERWFGRLSPRTAKVSGWIMADFLRWLSVNGGAFRGFDPDRLVAWQRAHSGGYEILDVVQDYLRWKKGRPGYKQRVYGSIRSFFAHNRAELPRDPLFKVKGNRMSVVGDLSVDEFRRVLLSCNSLYRAVFLCMFQGGMGVSELLHASENSYGTIMEWLRDRRGIIRVDLPGRKKLRNIKPYFTFIGKDAISALEVWLRERPSDLGSHLFYTQFNFPMTYKAMAQYWQRKLESLGIIKPELNNDSSNRYGKNLHELRDLFRTRWRPSGVDIEVAEYFMGHNIDSLGYDKSPRDYPEWFEEQYLLAEPWLNILSEDPERVPRAEMESTIRRMEEAQSAAQREILARLEYLERRLSEK